MRSRLGFFSVLLLLTPPCFSTSCRTCKNEECLKEDVLILACNKNTPVLPFQTQLNKNKEHLQYGCLQLEYFNGNSANNLEQCILTKDINEFCQNIAKSVNVIHCRVDLPAENRLKRYANENSNIAESILNDKYETTTFLNSAKINQTEIFADLDDTKNSDPDFIPIQTAYSMSDLNIDRSETKSRITSTEEELTTTQSSSDGTDITETKKIYENLPTIQTTNFFDFDNLESSVIEESTTTNLNTDKSESKLTTVYDEKLITTQPLSEGDLNIDILETSETYKDLSTIQITNFSDSGNFKNSVLQESTTNDLIIDKSETESTVATMYEEELATTQPSSEVNISTDILETSEAYEDLSTTQVTYSSIVDDLSNNKSETHLTTLLPNDSASSINSDKPSTYDDSTSYITTTSKTLKTSEALTTTEAINSSDVDVTEGLSEDKSTDFTTTKAPYSFANIDLGTVKINLDSTNVQDDLTTKGYNDFSTTALVYSSNVYSKFGEDSSSEDPETRNKYEDSTTTTTSTDQSNTSNLGSSGLSESTDYTTTQVTYSSVSVDLNSDKAETDLTTATLYDSTSSSVNSDMTTANEDMSTNKPTSLYKFSTTNLDLEISESTSFPTTIDTITTTSRDFITTQELNLSESGDAKSSDISETTELTTTEATRSTAIVNLHTNKTEIDSTTVTSYDSSSSSVNSDMTTNYEDLSTNKPTTLYEFSTSDLSTTNLDVEISESTSFSTTLNPITTTTRDFITIQELNLSESGDTKSSEISETTELTTTEATHSTEIINLDTDKSETDLTTVSSCTTNNCENLTTNEITTSYESSSTSVNIEDLSTTQLPNPVTGNSKFEEDSTTINFENLDINEDLSTTQTNDLEGSDETTDSSISTTTSPNSASAHTVSFIIYAPLIILSLSNLKLQ